MIALVGIEEFRKRRNQPADRQADVSGWRESLSIKRHEGSDVRHHVKKISVAAVKRSADGRGSGSRVLTLHLQV
jgi:hypothetical protein